MPDHSSNTPGSEPERHDLPGFLDGSDAGDFLGLGASAGEAPTTPIHEPEAALETSSQPTTALGSEPEVPSWALDEGEGETMSWLMELEEDGSDFLAAPPAEPASFGGDAEDFEPELVAEPAGNGWLVRLAIAGVSLGLGFAGAKVFSDRGTQLQQPAPRVAQVEPSTTTPETTTEPRVAPEVLTQDTTPEATPPVSETETTPAPQAQSETVASTEPTTLESTTPTGVGRPPQATPTVTPEVTPIATEVAVVTPSVPRDEITRGLQRNPRVRFTGPGQRQRFSPAPPVMTLEGLAVTGSGGATTSGPSVVVSQGSGQAPQVPGGQDVGATRVVRAPGSVAFTSEELGSKLREASSADLSGLWVGGSIPMEHIGGEDKLMTPGVGRVRVILTDGEVFEGDLYAVGESKVWIQTELGNMALLGWQVERVEHLLEETALPGSGVQVASLAGLESVRVRTPGGVFYGRLLEETERGVTLLTSEGARITLHDAQIDTAGRSATHLVDASGLVNEPAED
jgi:hypothetical protein